MRILYLIPTLGGGGAERQIGYLAGALRNQGWDVHIGIVRGGVNLARVEAGATVHRLRTLGKLPLGIGRLIRSLRPEIVQTWFPQMDIVGGLAAIGTRTPWIVSERISRDYYPRDMKHRLRRFIGSRAAAVIANSHAGARYWEGSCVKRFVVSNALVRDEIDAAQRDESDFGAAQVILFVGRFDPIKNLPGLIDAVAKVARERDVVALICGEGNLEDDVRARIVASGYQDRIRLLGFTDRVWSLMKRADVLVAPSWIEGHPNVPMEAAAAGCPLVISDIAGHREHFSDEAALFAEPGDTDAMARAILRALDDRPAAMVRADVAQSVAAEWTVERAVAEHIRIYDSVHGTAMENS